jgi:site-specific recombinase XerD
LRGWLAFYEYCKHENLSVNSVIVQDPIKLITQFIIFLQKQKLQHYAIIKAKCALTTVFEDILGKTNLGKNKLISAMLIPEQLHFSKKRKYTEIWDISLVLDYFRKQQINSNLSDFDIMVKAAILILVFTACRPAEVVSILPTDFSHHSGSEGGTLLLPTVVKQHKHEITNLQIQSLADTQICPVKSTLEWLKRRDALLPRPSTFLVTRSGRPMINAQLLANAIRPVLAAANIPTSYGSYSIKHATISALFRLGFSPTEINIFTGHSELANTAATFYLKSTGKWPGYGIAALSTPGGVETS